MEAVGQGASFEVERPDSPGIHGVFEQKPAHT